MAGGCWSIVCPKCNYKDAQCFTDGRVYRLISCHCCGYYRESDTEKGELEEYVGLGALVSLDTKWFDAATEIDPFKLSVERYYAPEQLAEWVATARTRLRRGRIAWAYYTRKGTTGEWEKGIILPRDEQVRSYCRTAFAEGARDKSEEGGLGGDEANKGGTT